MKIGIRSRTPLKNQTGATILEYIIYTVLALTVFAGVAVFALNANNNSNSLSLTKNLAGTEIAVKNFYQGGQFGTGSLNAVLITAGNIIPADWVVATPVITGQSGTNIVFTGATTTFTTTIGGMTKAVCMQILANSSSSQWSSVTVSGTSAGTAIAAWPITQAVAGGVGACGAAATAGYSAVFTAL